MPKSARGDKMNGYQCRMARAVLRMGVRDLASKANVSPSTIIRLEAGGDLRGHAVDDVRRALESAGVEFTNGEHPGVNLRKDRKL
jgi:hypothetical protein